MFCIRGFQHFVTRPRVLIPTAKRFQVHRTQLPLTEWIVDSCLETAMLLFLSHFHPVFDKSYPSVHEVFLGHWAEFQEPVMLLFRAKTHHVFHARTVVPTSIEDHDLTRGREVLHVALHIHLALLSIGRSGKGYDSEHTRTNPFRDRPDRAALSGGVPALEDNNHAATFVFDPVLEFAKFALEPAEFLLVLLALQTTVSISHFLISHWQSLL